MPHSIPRVDDPGYWRFLAVNVGALVKEVKDEKAKAIILHISGQYEELAKLAEERRWSAPKA